MSPKLRRLSAREVVAILQQFEFKPVSQRGSHIKLQRMSQAGNKETLTVPNHPELDRGTLRAIFRQASRYIAEGELFPHFYAD